MSPAPPSDRLPRALQRFSPTETQVLVVMGVVVGLGAGLGAVAFRYLINGFMYAFFDVIRPALATVLGPAAVVPLPALGGLLFGPLIYFFAREAKGHGVPEVMLAVAQRGGRIRPAVAVVKALASALCIGSGGSVGREGPIVQIGSALGSTRRPDVPHVGRSDPHACRVRCRGWHRRYLQCADRGCVLRPGGHSRRVHDARLRDRRHLQRHRVGHRACGVR